MLCAGSMDRKITFIADYVVALFSSSVVLTVSLGPSVTALEDVETLSVLENMKSE